MASAQTERPRVFPTGVNTLLRIRDRLSWNDEELVMLATIPMLSREENFTLHVNPSLPAERVVWDWAKGFRILVVVDGATLARGVEYARALLAFTEPVWLWRAGTFEEERGWVVEWGYESFIRDDGRWEHDARVAVARRLGALEASDFRGIGSVGVSAYHRGYDQ